MIKMNKLKDLVLSDPHLKLEDSVIYLPTRREKLGEIMDYYKPNKTIIDVLKIIAFLNYHNINLCRIETPALSRIIRKYIVKRINPTRARNLAIFLVDLRDYNLKGEVFSLPRDAFQSMTELKKENV